MNQNKQPGKVEQWVFRIVVGIGLLFLVQTCMGVPIFGTRVTELSVAEFKSSLTNDEIALISLDKEKASEGNFVILEGKLKDGRKFQTYVPLAKEQELLPVLKEKGLWEKPEYKSTSGGWGSILIGFLPLILFGGLLFFLFRSARGANNQALQFGRAKGIIPQKPNVKFDDVAGAKEAKEEVQEIIKFLKSPADFQRLGAKMPRGILLVGPPGCGKTLVARAIAGEAEVPFFSISGSQFVEMFVGVGAARVRDLFEQAKRNAPCIIFIDEIDAVGRHRGAGLGGGHDEREQTLNQILVEMDGFEQNTNVVVLAATNRPDILDPALLRPGRFDRQVILDWPDLEDRKAILAVHSKGKPLNSDVNSESVAKQTPGFSGADLANIVNEAAILAARRDRKDISMREMNDAIDRVIAGPERKGRVISKKEKEIIAFHEAGHALVAKLLEPLADPVQKISVVARGMMGGFTKFLPQEERRLWTKSQFKAKLAVSLGGYEAENLTYGEVTTGSQNDLAEATKIARKMVKDYGMSEKLGARTFGKKESMIFLAREISEERDYSEKTAEEIDREVNQLIEGALNTAREKLSQNKAKLEQIVQKLIIVETLESEAFEALFNAPEEVSE